MAIISLFLPPLRDRREDILPLVHFFIERYNRRFRKSVRGITPETRELLSKYDWPGNVRELKNAIERAMILEDDDMLRPVYLPFSVGSPLSSLTAFEVSSGGNVAAHGIAGTHSDAQAHYSETQVVNGKTSPDFRFLKAARVWRRLSARLSKWPCSKPTATRHKRPNCSTSAAMRCATS